MPPTLESQLKKVARAFLQSANKMSAELALAVVDAVAEHTPVDTGRARSNWQVGVGSPENAPLEPYHPGDGLGRGEVANLAAVMSTARDKLSGYRGGEIYVTNNTKDPKTGENYIHDLDKGSSRQSPGDFQGVAEAAASAFWLRNR